MPCRYIFILVVGLLFGVTIRSDAEDIRSNILWIMLEDWCPDLSAYGTKGISTPNCDRLADEGTRYENAFCTAPVCSSSRSAMMTGFHQNYIGAHQHRTNQKKPLPHGIKPMPVLLKEAGYFTCLMDWKTDCNFSDDLGFMGKDWGERSDGQPFFAQLTISGTHRPWQRDAVRPIEGADVVLPPYYADTPLARRDWANGLEQMQICDREIGRLLERLDSEGLSASTLVFLIGDNGRCHIRGKQFLYDSGLHVPAIARWPGKVAPGQVNSELIQTIDITATILHAAGVTPSYTLHGRDLFDEQRKPRDYVFAARDKMDDTHDAMRMIRGKRYKLIHNLMHERPWLQYNKYKETHYPMLAEMSVLYLEGKLTPAQAAFFAPRKPEFELFDLQTDPHETKNLAGDPHYADIQAEFLRRLNAWRESVNDQGVSEAFRKGGRPSVYPTKPVNEWAAIVDKWRPWVRRTPGAAVEHPFR
jgi:N-sulfoglucosamine sulfohydrolase